MAKGTSSRRHEKVGTPGILYAVQITEPVDIFEMMIMMSLLNTSPHKQTYILNKIFKA